MKATQLTILAGLLAILAGLLAAGTAGAGPIQWKVADGGNNHYYEFVLPDGSGVDWNAARAAAKGSSHMGYLGYLATITSAAEQSFIFDHVTSSRAWIGGSDADSEDDWKWVDGPEAGDTLVYTPWAPGEPNNVGNEDYLIFGWNNDGALGGWNDLPSNNAYGYVVEYGGDGDPNDLSVVPEPGTLLLFGTGLAGLGLRSRKKA